MSQSLAKLYVHLDFSTKNRERILAEDDSRELHSYIGGTLKGMGCVPVEINSEPDHVHVLFLMGRSIGLSDIVGGLKKSATGWLRSRSPRYKSFHWQVGYGAFSVSQSAVDDVRKYISAQHEHHRVRTFQEEYLAMLRKYQVEYDAKYLWE